MGPLERPGARSYSLELQSTHFQTMVHGDAMIDNNDVLRSIRFMLNVDDAKLAAIAALGGLEVEASAMTTFLAKEGEPGYAPCPDRVLAHLLDGLVIYERGRDESRPKPPVESRIDSNVILKKLRVAFALKEEDCLAVMRLADFPVSKPELSALFRAPGHPNYRACGDQFLRNFLKGLTRRVRR